MTAVHQFHPVLAPGDAMSNHVFALHKRLRQWGHESAAYAIEAKPGADRDALPYRRLFRNVKPNDLLILHFSMGHEVFDQLVKLPARKVLVYHNITPAEFFAGINPHSATFARLGRRQLASLAPKVDLAIGVSEFNTRELTAAGFSNTATVPILIDWDSYDRPADEGVVAAHRGHTNLLFVGRISPNKRQDDLIRMLAYYRRCIDGDARLILLGSYRDQPQYHVRLVALARELDLQDAVVFTGSIPFEQVLAYYKVASVFVSLSEHEGFCVPLLEAMYLRVPVVAYDAAAIGETAGDAAVLLSQRDLAEAAEACAIAIDRPRVRATLLDRGRRRVAHFDADRVAGQTRAALGL